MGATKYKRAFNKSMCQKISIRTHTTTNSAKSYLPLMYAQANHFANDSAQLFSFSAFYNFDEDDLAKLLNISPDTVNGNAKKQKK